MKVKILNRWKWWYLTFNIVKINKQIRFSAGTQRTRARTDIVRMFSLQRSFILPKMPARQSPKQGRDQFTSHFYWNWNRIKLDVHIIGNLHISKFSSIFKWRHNTSDPTMCNKKKHIEQGFSTCESWLHGGQTTFP